MNIKKAFLALLVVLAIPLLSTPSHPGACSDCTRKKQDECGCYVSCMDGGCESCCSAQAAASLLALNLTPSGNGWGGILAVTQKKDSCYWKCKNCVPASQCA